MSKRGKSRLEDVMSCLEQAIGAQRAETVEQIELKRLANEAGEEEQLVDEAHLRNRLGQKMNEMQRRNEASKERRDFTAKRLQRESALIIEEHNRRSN